MSHSHHETPIILRKQSARRRVGNRKPQRFVSLHHHSTYSYLDGIQLPDAHVRRVSELNMSALAMTEHGNVSSHVKLEQAALGQGVKPIFGCEVYMGGVTEDTRTQRKYHLTILAATDQGYRNLLQLVTASYAEGFYYEPTVSPAMLKKYREGLIILSGCQGSLLFCSLVGGKLIPEKEASYQKAKRVARHFKKAFGDSYYIELQGFPELEKTCAANPMLAQIGDELGIPLVATLDCHYTEVVERELQQVLHNIRPGNQRTIEDQAREWGYKAALCPPPNDNSIYRKMIATGLTKEQAIQAVYNTEVIAGRCNVTLPKLPMVRYPCEGESKDLWRQWIREGWNYRGFDSLAGEELARYTERLKHERSVIESKDYYDYFLVVADAVRYAKDAGIPVGPARGSAAASLICYLLRITEVNPMLYEHLVFERFIDATRIDLPDIDLDFDVDRRSEVREYLVARYGAECVGNIGTSTSYQSRLALDDVARAHRIPRQEVEALKALLPEVSDGDSIRQMLTDNEAAIEIVKRHPKLMIAAELEGNIKGAGVHAAGVVVSNQPIKEVCAVYSRKVNNILVDVVSLDKYDAERQGLLKIDLLGLSTMSMVAECLRQLDLDLDYLYGIDLSDPVMLDGFTRNDVVGIFQFEGRSQKLLNEALKTDSFREICDMNALSRPGPLHSGSSQMYIDIKHGRKQPTNIHPSLEGITRSTNYQIIYQEQIIRVAREIGDFGWEEATRTRKIIGQKQGGGAFNKQREAYLKGALSVHDRADVRPMSEDEANRIWDACATAGNYAFNAAHAVAYGTLAAWCMHLKQHHPEAFYAAALNKMPRRPAKGNNVDSHVTLMRDAIRYGIKLLPPDPNKSGASWQQDEKGYLRGGFAQIDGIAGKTAQAVVNYRDKHGPYDSWQDISKVPGIGKTRIGQMQNFAERPDPYSVETVANEVELARAALTDLGLKRATHTSAQVPSESGQDTSVVWVGVIINKVLRDKYEQHLKHTGEELDPTKLREPELRELMVLTGYDGDDTLGIRIDRFKYPQFKDLVDKIETGKSIVYVDGVKHGYRSAREISVQRMCVMEI